MSSIWGTIKDKAAKVGTAATVASQRTKLRTEILLIDRELKQRQQAFGCQLYDYVSPLAKTPSFFASDDTLTTTLRPPLITAQREIAALEIKVDRQKEFIHQAIVKRKSAFPNPATNWQEKLTNAGKSTAMVGNETKLKTELSMLEVQVKAHKQQFGLDLYPTLEKMEDTQGWLPTDREIRSIYDTCRKDSENIKLKKTMKQIELTALGGGNPHSTDTNNNQQQQEQHTQHQQEQHQQGGWQKAVAPERPAFTPPPPTATATATATPASSMPQYADPFADPFGDPFGEAPSPQRQPQSQQPSQQPSHYSDVPLQSQQQQSQSQSQYQAPQLMGGSSNASLSNQQQGSQQQQQQQQQRSNIDLLDLY
jgi:hypothetical protein